MLLNPKNMMLTVGDKLTMPEINFNFDIPEENKLETPKFKVQTLDDVKKNGKKETENLF